MVFQRRSQTRGSNDSYGMRGLPALPLLLTITRLGSLILRLARAGLAILSGRFPVIPQTRRDSASSGVSLKSTHVNWRRNMGNSGISLAFANMTGITGHLRRTNSERNARISTLCQGPMPDRPTNTAALSIAAICSSRTTCHAMPGRNCSSSNHVLIPRASSFRLMMRTSALSCAL